MIIVVIILLLLMAILGFFYAGFIHICLKREFKDKELLDNSEYDFGHDVQYKEDINS